jgi:hypothetical protein
MKLKSVMKDYLLREEGISSFLSKILPKVDDFPCQVKGSSKWNEEGGASSKEFTFSSRESLHSFCEYIFDLEGQNGISVAMSLSAEENNVMIKVPHYPLVGGHFAVFFKEIDNVYLDVVESFKDE